MMLPSLSQSRMRGCSGRRRASRAQPRRKADRLALQMEKALDLEPQALSAPSKKGAKTAEDDDVMAALRPPPGMQAGIMAPKVPPILTQSHPPEPHTARSGADADTAAAAGTAAATRQPMRQPRHPAVIIVSGSTSARLVIPV